MCEWYYDGGGIYLSNEAMAHYRMVQEALTTFDTATPHELLDDQEYDDLRWYLSNLRTELTKDLLSRHAPFEITRDVGKQHTGTTGASSDDGTSSDAKDEP